MNRFNWVYTGITEKIATGKGWRMVGTNMEVQNKDHLKAVGVPQYAIFFQPQEDITAFELVQAMPIANSPNRYHEPPLLPPTVARHFLIKKMY